LEQKPWVEPGAVLQYLQGPSMHWVLLLQGWLHPAPHWPLMQRLQYELWEQSKFVLHCWLHWWLPWTHLPKMHFWHVAPKHSVSLAHGIPQSAVQTPPRQIMQWLSGIWLQSMLVWQEPPHKCMGELPQYPL